MHELHQQYSSQNSSALPANGFLPKFLFCGALAAGYQCKVGEEIDFRVLVYLMNGTLLRVALIV